MKDLEFDYKNFRIGKLFSKEYRYMLLLLYWPIFGLTFVAVEWFVSVDVYYPVHCFVDDWIPFCAYFIIPYIFWYVYMAGMVLYTFFFDIWGFRRFMWFLILTFTVSFAIYLFFPNCQELRPETFPKENLFTGIVGGIYQLDTSTNVCPSMHVLGSMGVMFAAWHTKRFSSRGWKWAFAFLTVLISISTLFVKQHSFLDILMALPLGIAAYFICYQTNIIKNGIPGQSRGNE